MKRKILSAVLAIAMAVGLMAPAASAAKAADSEPLSWAELQAKDAEVTATVKGEASGQTVTLQDLVDFALLYSGMEERQLGQHPRDWNKMAESANLVAGIDYSDPTAVATKDDFNSVMAESKPLYDALHAEKLQPLFINGLAQPIFPYTSGEVEEGYSNEDSDIIRYFVYVETNHDTDLDGKLDLVKALVEVPRAAAEGDYKAATIYEARPYCAGGTGMYGPTNSDGTWGKPGDYDLKGMYSQPAARQPVATATTMEAAANADSAEWYYYDQYKKKMQYENLTWYDYFLVRGYAVVVSAGLGTLDSEGMETCGTDLEIDAFKCVIEWLHGDRVAYTDKESNIKISADWSSGKVGMTGRSYSGTTQFGLATTGVEGLEAIVPVAGIASWYEYTFSQGVPHVDGTVSYSDDLSSYCASGILEPESWEQFKDTYFNYLETIRLEQVALNGDYDGQADSHWTIRDYTRSGSNDLLDTDNIKAPALIVHGLNDENVRTKQFDMMYRAYEQAGVTHKLVLHQNGHLTPTYATATAKTEAYIGDELYDVMLNRWFSHYLYGVDNGAENMPAITAQSNVDGSWKTYDADKWTMESGMFRVIEEEVDEETEEPITHTITTNSNRGWYKPAECFEGSNENAVVVAIDMDEDMTINGVGQVYFTAHTTVSEKNTDNLKISAYLYDVSDEEFAVFNRSGSYLPQEVVEKGGAWVGGGAENYDLVQYLQTKATYKMVEYGWMDLCNPDASYESVTASRDYRVDLASEEEGTTHDYVIYMNPNLYEVKEGHKLVLVLITTTGAVAEDKAYTVDISNVRAEIPFMTESWFDPYVPAHEHFIDVNEGDWFCKAVDYVYDRSWMVGVSEDHFAPDDTLTRAMLVQILYAKEDYPYVENEVTFRDVNEGDWYADAVRWAAANGLVAGYSKLEFGANDPITREQMVAILYRYALMKDASYGEESGSGNLGFIDAGSISHYALKAIQWAVKNDLIAGVGNNLLNPTATTTRAQTAQVLMQMAKANIG